MAMPWAFIYLLRHCHREKQTNNNNK